MRYPWMLVLVLAPILSHAHSGRTDASGCHHDRKHGGYHCHNGGSASSLAAPTARASSIASTPSQAPTVTPATPGAVNPFLPQSTPPAKRDLAQQEDNEAEEVVPGLYFQSCRQAYQAGHVPLIRGQSGYREALDSDGDGVACEEMLLSR